MNVVPLVTETFADVPARNSYRTLAFVAGTLALGLAGAVALVWPELRQLVGYGLYAVPAHLLISVLSNEAMLLSAAKTFSPSSIAIAGTAGCLVAIILDYAFIGWLVNQRLVRTEINESRGFGTAQRIFSRAPFVLILGSALLPVPFYPVKILAIVRDYSITRFAIALALGRLPRFYLLALGGKKVQAPDSALLSAGVALALIAGWGVWRTYRRNRHRAKTGQE